MTTGVGAEPASASDWATISTPTPTSTSTSAASKWEDDHEQHERCWLALDICILQWYACMHGVCVVDGDWRDGICGSFSWWIPFRCMLLCCMLLKSTSQARLLEEFAISTGVFHHHLACDRIAARAHARHFHLHLPASNSEPDSALEQ